MRTNVEVEPFNGAPPLPEPPPSRKRVRYAEGVALPTYRYVPGSGLPHPVNDPRGSLYSDEKPPPREPWTPHLWPVMDDWLHGVDLFNHWYFWEAHEALEGLWQVADKSRPHTQLVQSVIMLSAAMLKVHLASPRGVEGLWSSARARLVAVAEEHRDLMGLRPARVVKDFDAFLKPLAKGRMPTLGKDVPLLLLDV